jgi:hypothetical protein
MHSDEVIDKKLSADVLASALNFLFGDIDFNGYGLNSSHSVGNREF